MVGLQLVNQTKQLEIAQNVEVAASWLTRLRGLLGRDSLPEGSSFILYPCNSIHTCFMKFNIDVLFVSREGIIKHIIEDMPAFKFSPIVRMARFCIELPAHTVQSTGTTIGDQLNITEQELKSL